MSNPAQLATSKTSGPVAIANWGSTTLRAVGVIAAACVAVPGASAQQVMWKDNPISGKVVGLTYGTSSWTAAEAQAVAYGGHLAAIRSQAEQDWLVQQFASNWSVNFSGTLHGPWFGLNDAAQHSNWVYPSGDPVSYTFWAPGQGPAQSFGTIENYALLAFGSENWRWHDAAEYAPLRSLIEVSQRPPRSWSWTTTYAAGAYALYGDVADLNGDGNLDVIVPQRDAQRIGVWFGDGTGAFSANPLQISWSAAPHKAVAADLNNDGFLDIVCADYGSLGDATRVSYGDGNGQFGTSVQVPGIPPLGFPHWIVCRDMNGDSLVDVVIANHASNQDSIRVYNQSNNGVFVLADNIANMQDEYQHIAVSDLNRDGLMDIVSTSGSSLGAGIRVALSRNDGGFFSAVSYAAGGPCGLPSIADIDGDGDNDIASPSFGGSVNLWMNNGFGVFVVGQVINTGTSNQGSALADLDGDLDVDMVVACSLSDQNRFYYNDGSGSFVIGEILSAGDGPHYVAPADLNGDAKPDLMSMSVISGTMHVVLNQSIFDCNGNGIDDPLDITSGFATDCNSNGRPDTCDLAFGLSQDSDGDGILNECEPTLVSITPNLLPAFVGGTVTVRSTNIPNGTVRLDLGGTPLPFTLTDNVGTVTIPPLTAASSSDLTAAGTLGYLGPNGPEVTGTLAAAFTWDVPEITGATPGSAPYDQATGVAFTLEDSTLLSATGTAVFGNSPPQAAYLITANGHSKVITTAPAQAAPGPVSVLLRFGNEQTLANRGFVYLGPGITNTSVSNGWQAGGQALTLDLVDFVPGVPIDVRLGTGITTGTPVGLLTASTLSVTTPYTAAAGVVDIELVQNAGQPNEKRVLSPGAWLADAPQVIAATPANAYQGGGDAVSIAVAGFVPSSVSGQTARVEIGSSVLGYVSVDAVVAGTLDAATVDFTMPLAPFAGACDVVVTQQAGTPNELRALAAGAFTVVGASIASLSPTSGPLEGGTTVVVQTSGFQAGTAAQVLIGGTTVPGVVVGSGANQTVTFRTILAAASGPSDVNITQGVFNAVLPGAFAFDAARVIGYCTPKVTSQGTTPIIGFTGSPSVATGDFRITLATALPNKTAQYFYGPATSNFPIYGGTLCVGGSIIRGPLSATNAQSAASVAFPVTGLLVGQKRYVQWWFRDPLDPFGRGFSAGLEVEFYN
jgi:hypothetical protein